MDLRIEKTKSTINNAFLELRSKKPLEKIKVKELCELAQINKSTFYSHYTDIYDLSEQMENEVIQSVFNGLSCPEELLDNPEMVTKEIIISYLAWDNLFRILFSGSRSAELITKLERQIKQRIFSVHPEYENDLEKNIVITYTIYGSYYAFHLNRERGEYDAIDYINHLTHECLKFI